MQINPPTQQIGLSNAGQAQAVGLTPNGGGSSGGAADGVRADWNVRLNVSHESGFVGGAGRILIHNQVAEDRTELSFFLPAMAHHDNPGRLEMASAVVCSAKPGSPAVAGQSLTWRVEGPRAILTVPVLKLNDWIYLDLTWTGAFPLGGMNFMGAQVPLGEFHPQLAVEVDTDSGRRGLALVQARYDCEIGSDPGARIMLDSDEHGSVLTRASEDGHQTLHKFASYGRPQIQARLAPPGAVISSPLG